MKIVILTLLALLSSVRSFAKWDLNDVSYLLPLPTAIGADQLLGLEAPARGGALLDPRLLAKIPVLTVNHSRAEILESLRVIAVRIDPCFPLPTPQACQPQIRLVWQPIEMSRKNYVETIDAALHSFYILTGNEFSRLLNELSRWKKSFPAPTQFQALQIHPAWAEEGDSSPALAAFQAIVKKYAGMENLNRVTAMVLRGNADMWAFVGIEKNSENEFVNMQVPRIQRFNQTFINMAVPQDHFSGGGISPAPRGPDTLNNLAFDSDVLEEGFEDLIRQEVGAAFRVQNPHTFNPENMDCVSCHVAQSAQQWVLNKRPDLQGDQIWNSEIYKNAKYDLRNLSPEVWNTHSVRAFGYFGRNMAVSQRVINESAVVADYINQLTR